MNSFYSKLAGTTFDGRQDIIENLADSGMLNAGQMLAYRREPNNPYDRNAIAVLHPNTMQQLGYIGRDVASTIAPKIDRGIRFGIEVSSGVTGGSGYSYGVNIKITEY